MSVHDAAFGWLADTAGRVMEDVPGIGQPLGLDVGAGGPLGAKVRGLFDPVRWATVDWNPETEPDVVADMTVMVLPDALPGQGYDVVLCTEVLEHVPAWKVLLFNCVRLVAPGGHLVVTCAGPGREPHSGLDGGPLRPTEPYANIDPRELVEGVSGLVEAYGLVWRQFIHDSDAHDLYLHMQARHRAATERSWAPEMAAMVGMIPEEES